MHCLLDEIVDECLAGAEEDVGEDADEEVHEEAVVDHTDNQDYNSEECVVDPLCLLIYYTQHSIPLYCKPCACRSLSCPHYHNLLGCHRSCGYQGWSPWCGYQGWSPHPAPASLVSPPCTCLIGLTAAGP